MSFSFNGVRSDRHRFPLSDCVTVVFYDGEGNRLYSKSIHKYSPRYVIAHLCDYVQWRFRLPFPPHYDILGRYDSRESDLYFARDYEPWRFYY